MSERWSEALEREMISASTLEPRRTLSVTVASVIAGMVYLGALCVAAAGVVVLVTGWPGAGMIVLGAALLAIGLVICPRPFARSRLRDEPDAASTPQLDAVIATLARALDVEGPDRIVYDLRFNASWGHDGWRRRRVLRLGVPLLAALDTGPTLALLAHERNGDARRGLIVGSSLASLSSAVDLLGGQRVRGHRSLNALTLVLTNALLWLCRQPLRGLLTLQAHLLFRNSQRAEYLADELAASLAGTDAVIALHDVLLAAPAVHTAIRRVTLTDDRTPSTVLAHIRDAATPADPTQLRERRRRAATTRQRLMSTHPTMVSRIAVLQQRSRRPAAVVLNPADIAALTDELYAEIARHTPALIERDLERLAYGG